MKMAAIQFFFYVLYKMNKSNNLSVSVKWIVYFLSVAVVCFGLLLVLFFYIYFHLFERMFCSFYGSTNVFVHDFITSIKMAV